MVNKLAAIHTNYLLVSHYINHNSFPTKTLTFAAAFSALGHPIPWPIATAPTAWSSVRHSLHRRSPWRPLAQVGSSSLLKSVCKRGIMNRLGSWLMVTFFLASVISSSMFLTATAANPLSSNLTFNPIKPATGWTASAVPVLDPVGQILDIVVFTLWFFGLLLVRRYVWFYIILLLVTMVLYYPKEGFHIERLGGVLIVLMLSLLWNSRSRLKRIWFQFRIFFTPLVILLFMFVVVMVDIKIYPTEVSFVVVSTIEFSLWSLLPYPTGELDVAIWSSFIILLTRPQCSTYRNCGVGLYCQSCRQGTLGPRCVPLPFTDPLKLINNSLPFNKYAFLTTHNAYAIEGEPSHTGVPRVTFNNQEDTVTQQLKNGVRALMLDTYDFEGDIWLCHSHGGECYDVTAFGPAIDTMKEIEAFLSQNPSEIITLILEDYVQAPNGLTKLFNDSGLSKYWFPLSNMPLNGQDWPLVSDMVANNQRLLVFTSIKSKQDTEGIAYQWNYMVENQHGDDGMHPGICSNRSESSPLHDKSKSLVLVNFFKKIPFEKRSCAHHGRVLTLINMLHTCYGAAGDRWANFVAVDYYTSSSDEVPFQAVNTLNGKLLCGCDDVNACVVGGSWGRKVTDIP